MLLPTPEGPDRTVSRCADPARRPPSAEAADAAESLDTGGSNSRRNGRPGCDRGPGAGCGGFGTLARFPQQAALGADRA
ncbi:hypothetical protein GCM10027570_18960 [Streptomonospora sediminis]